MDDPNSFMSRIVNSGTIAGAVALQIERVTHERAIDRVVDLGLMLMEVTVNIGQADLSTGQHQRKHNKYLRIDAVFKARVDAWAVWGIKAAHLQHLSELARKADGAVTEMDKSERVLRSQIEAFRVWDIDAKLIKHQLLDRMKQNNMTYSEKVQDYFERMLPPPLLPPENVKKSCPNLATNTAPAMAFPLRNALSLPAGLDFPRSSQQSLDLDAGLNVEQLTVGYL